jgi:hypothetical protein
VGALADVNHRSNSHVKSKPRCLGLRIRLPNTQPQIDRHQNALEGEMVRNVDLSPKIGNRHARRMYCSIQLLGCGTKIIYALNLVAMVVVNVDLGGYTEDLDFTTWSKAPQR